jgi:hypothetical protein
VPTAKKANIRDVHIGDLGVIIAIGLGLIIARSRHASAGRRSQDSGRDCQSGGSGRPEPGNHAAAGDTTSVMAAMKKMVSAFNDITANAKQVSQGNLMVDIKKRSEKDELLESLAAMVEN